MGLRAFAARLRPGAVVLDLGCGGGWASVMLARAGHRVIAVDASPAMLAETRARAAAAGVGGRVRTLRAPAEALPPLGRLGGVWASFVLQHLPRRQLPAVLARLARLLVPGAPAYLALHTGSEALRDRLGRLYHHWSAGALTALAGRAGLVPAWRRLKAEHGYDGRPILALEMILHRRG